MSISFFRNSAAILLGLAVVFVGLTDVAVAGAFVTVPGPVAGAGLPALAIAGGALWLFSKRHGRR
jgi:hypothetical protein